MCYVAPIEQRTFWNVLGICMNLVVLVKVDVPFIRLGASCVCLYCYKAKLSRITWSAFGIPLDLWLQKILTDGLRTGKLEGTMWVHRWFPKNTQRKSSWTTNEAFHYKQNFCGVFRNYCIASKYKILHWSQRTAHWLHWISCNLHGSMNPNMHYKPQNGFSAVQKNKRKKMKAENGWRVHKAQ